MDSAVVESSPRPWALHLGTMAAILGMLLCVVLCQMHLAADPAGCPSGGGCARLMASRWSAPLGVPLALLGFVFEALLLQALARAAVSPSARAHRWVGTLLTAALIAVGASLLLMVHLHGACPLCLALDGALVAQAALFALWLRAQPAADPGLAGTPAILRLVYPLIFVPTFLLVAVDLQREHERRHVVASVGDVRIAQSDLERLGVGMRQADRAIDSDIDRALLRRRLDIDLIARQAEAARQDATTYLRAQAHLDPSVSDAGAEQEAVERLHAAADMLLVPPREAVVRPADYDSAWSAGSPQAPIRVLAVIRPDCGVCMSQIRELVWCRVHGHGIGDAEVRISVLIANDEQTLRAPPAREPASAPADAVTLSRAVAAGAAGPRVGGEPPASWRMLVRIGAQADPSAITRAQVLAWLHDEGLSESDLSAGDAALLAQAATAHRLLGRDATPRLFLQDMPLGGYCPRERLCGAIGEAQALLAGHEVATELDPALQVSASAGFVSPPNIAMAGAEGTPGARCAPASGTRQGADALTSAHSQVISYKEPLHRRLGPVHASSRRHPWLLPLAALPRGAGVRAGGCRRARARWLRRAGHALGCQPAQADRCQSFRGGLEQARHARARPQPRGQAPRRHRHPRRLQPPLSQHRVVQ